MAYESLKSTVWEDAFQLESPTVFLYGTSPVAWQALLRRLFSQAGLRVWRPSHTDVLLSHRGPKVVLQHVTCDDQDLEVVCGLPLGSSCGHIVVSSDLTLSDTCRWRELGAMDVGPPTHAFATRIVSVVRRFLACTCTSSQLVVPATWSLDGSDSTDTDVENGFQGR